MSKRVLAHLFGVAPQRDETWWWAFYAPTRRSCDFAS